ncbi:MAG: hypothetical protein HYY67_00515 [Thaumarchaeota archaeon]|jgi:hypothetical protein|nr:hypothetical protein [Nitrososphaerota archaeon]
MIKCCYYEKETKEKSIVVCTTGECPEMHGWARIGEVNGSNIAFHSPRGIDVEYFKGQSVDGEFCPI